MVLSSGIEEAFNTQDYLYFYNSRLSKKRTLDEVNFLIEHLNLQLSDKIIDIPC